jgi:hypothetical protein
MKYSIHILISCLVLLSACTTSEEPIILNEDQSELDTIDQQEDPIELDEVTEVDRELKLDTFNGQWFSIAYPEDFIPHPNSPIDTFDDYEFVETDEAVFTSSNGDIEFFVFSPQWGGNPKSYWDALPNEKIESDKSLVDPVDPNIVSRWVTFADKKGRYQRSFYSRRTESTHLVFGIKSKDQATYDKFKPAYSVFKASLEQYAD